MRPLEMKRGSHRSADFVRQRAPEDWAGVADRGTQVLVEEESGTPGPIAAEFQLQFAGFPCQTQLVAKVNLDRVNADIESICNFLIGSTSRDQP